MLFKKFAQLSREYFAPFLSSHGFDYTRETSPLYFRKNANQIYHFVSPRLGSRGVWFDIMVFAHSPLISDDFEERFLEAMDVPSDTLSYLHPILGVGFRQKLYRCNREEGFIRNFTREAKPALQEFGVPHLDRIQTLEDLVRTIHPNVRHCYKIPKHLT